MHANAFFARLRSRWIPWSLVGGVILLQTTTTRGRVEDPTGRPLAGADVVLAHAAGIHARTTTARNGSFRFVHRPLDRNEYSLLICAPDHGARVVSPAGSAIFDSTYGLERLSASAAFWTPYRLGWRQPSPRSCPGDPSDSLRGP